MPPGESRVRCYVGLRLAPELAQALAQRVAGALAPERWRRTRADTLHLTLAFLGDLEAARLEQLGVALSNALVGARRPRLRLSGLDAFPPGGPPRVAWSDVQDPGGALGDLRARVLAARQAVDPAGERGPWRAHVTLARAKRGGDPERLAADLVRAAACARPPLGFDPGAVELVRTRPPGPEGGHQPLAAFPLEPDGWQDPGAQG